LYVDVESRARRQAQLAEGDLVGDALRAVSLALRTDKYRTRRELLRLLADLEDEP
jgi:hypothetical protein